jgi:hypothetical protein
MDGGDYEIMPTGSSGIRDIIDNVYRAITNRDFGEPNLIPEEIIDVFN